MDRSNLTVKEIIIVDDLNLLDHLQDLGSLSNKLSCIDSDETECLLVDLKYSYKESPAI